MRISRWVVGLIGVALLAPVPTAPATADLLTPTELPLLSYGDMYVDERGGRVFISGGLNDAKIVVADTRGQITDIIDNMPGAFGMARSETPDAVWVALSKGDAVVEISTVDYTELRRIEFPAGACPEHIAATANKLVVQTSQDCDYYNSELYTVDLSGTAEPVFWEETRYPYSLATSPGRPGSVVLVDDWNWTRVFAITGPTPVETNSAWRDDVEPPAATNPEGTLVIAAGGDRDAGTPIRSLPELNLVTMLQPGEATLLPSWTADGTLLAAIAGVRDPEGSANWVWAARVYDAVTYEEVATSILPDDLNYFRGFGVSAQTMTAYVVHWSGSPYDTMDLLSMPLGQTPRDLSVRAVGLDVDKPDYVHATLYDSDFKELDTHSGSRGYVQTFDLLLPGTYYLYVWDGNEHSEPEYFSQWYSGIPGARQDIATPLVMTGDADVTIELALYPLYTDAGSVFASDILWLGDMGITKGCNPPNYDQFCPTDLVTRGQMAAFLDRALGLTDRGDIDFIDDNGSMFEASIERLAAAGITRGCNPPDNDRFCPDDYVTRGQMASFLDRALGLPAATTIDFADDNGSVFESAIERLAAAGITRGCNPDDNTMFCPWSNVTREQMAAFLHRALGS